MTNCNSLARPLSIRWAGALAAQSDQIGSDRFVPLYLCAFMAAAAEAEADCEARIGCPAYAACDLCTSFTRLCRDKARTVGGLTAAGARKEKEKEKATMKEKARLKKLRRRRRKANRCIDDHCEQGAGCGADGYADRGRKADMAVEEHREQGAGCGDDGWADLEPLFFDEAAAVAEHGRRMQKEQQRREKEAHNRKLNSAREAALDRIREYDPKIGKDYYTRLEYVDDIATFDHDEESPLGPMRYTEALIYERGSVQVDSANRIITFSQVGDMRQFVLEDSANVFSIKIVSSDVGYPIHVYGTVIARDNIDLKCVYLFRRDRDHCQLILSKDESLILTGPKRGLALKGHIYFEFDLKIKCAGRQKDKQLSKGYMDLNAVMYGWWEETKVERITLDTKLSKVMITHAVVHTAVEATFAIEVLQGRFYGELIAHTTGIRDSIVLHDSKTVEAMTNSGKGVIQLLRNVIAVNMNEKLIFTVVARTGDGKTKITTSRFTPGLTGGEEKYITCGSIKMCVKVTWSIISSKLYKLL